jgi:hypothetical protein
MMGLRAELVNKHTVETVTKNGNRLLLEQEILGQGYYIKPTSEPIVRIIDKEQKNLLAFNEGENGNS